MRTASWKATVTGLLFALPFGACECGTAPTPDAGPTVTCGAGTVLKDGECVAEETPEPDAGPGLECGAGTVLNQDGTACIPDIECADGTEPNEDGTGCVASCEDPFVLEDDSCVCPPGLVPTPAGNDCQIDPALCGEGTAFVNGACLPIVAPEPSDDDTAGGTPVSFNLPAVGEKPFEVGGVVGPVDREDGADIDVFEFDGAAGDRLLVQVVSFGAQAGSFIIQGIPDTPTEPYFRAALPLSNSRAVRHVVLPLTGRYAIIVTDKSNLTGGLPTGGDDHTYSLLVSREAAATPTVISADGTSNTGSHDAIDAYRVDAATVPAGSILSASLAEDEVDPEVDTVQLLWYVDPATNTYVEFAPPEDFSTPRVDVLLTQLGSGITLYVDYQVRFGLAPSWDYNLNVSRPQVYDGPVANDGPIDGETGGNELTFFEVDLAADNVYRFRMQLPGTTTIEDAFLALVDSNLNVIAQSSSTTVSGVSYEQIRYFASADAAGTHYLVIVDGTEQNPIEQPNFNARLSLDGAAVAYTASVSEANPTATTTLDDPADTDADAWTGPWILARAAGVVDLTLETDSDVTFTAFNAATFGTVTGATVDREDESVYARLYQLPPGVQVLLRAEDGDQSGQFTFTATAEASPYDWESEPNDGSGSATELPVAETWNGFTGEGDADWWAITVDGPGMLTVETDEGPLADSDHLLSVFAADGTTLLAGPDAGYYDLFSGYIGAEVSTYVPAAGTYYAVVEYDGWAGDYAISWSFDDTVEAPSTCAAPIDASELGTFTGDLTVGVNNWVPADSSCTGWNSYAGNDHVYSLRVPAGARLQATASSAADLALALIPADACSGACLVGIDGGNPEVLVYQNTGSEALDVLLIVDAYGSFRSTYTLEIELLGETCNAGEQRCADPNTLEVCNDNLDGFEQFSCPGGCQYDDFEQRGQCLPYCGGDTGLPVARCDGTTLESCTDDQARYEATSCAVECSDVLGEDNTTVVDALCTFGLCPGALGGTTCAVETIDGVDVAIETSCNDDASTSSSFSCLGTCDEEGTACAPYTPPEPSVVTAPAPAEGACALDGAPEITASGIYTVTLSAPSNDFDDPEFDGLWDGCSQDGTDVYWKIPAQAPGTTIAVEVLPQGANLDADTDIALISTPDCDASTAECLVSNDSGGEEAHGLFVYEVQAEDTGDLLLLVDSWDSYGALVPGELAVRVEILAPPPAFCEAGTASCDAASSTLSTCDAAGSAEETVYCELGCTDELDACQVQVGESCQRPEPLDVSTGSASVELDLSEFRHDMAGSCASTSGRERVFTFTAPVSGTVEVEALGWDFVLYAFEGACGEGDAELVCEDGYGTTESMEFDVTAGENYFVVVDLYFSSDAGSDTALTVTLTEAVIE